MATSTGSSGNFSYEPLTDNARYEYYGFKATDVTRTGQPLWLTSGVVTTGRGLRNLS